MKFVYEKLLCTCVLIPKISENFGNFKMYMKKYFGYVCTFFPKFPEILGTSMPTNEKKSQIILYNQN